MKHCKHCHASPEDPRECHPSDGSGPFCCWPAFWDYQARADISIKAEKIARLGGDPMDAVPYR